MKLQEWEIQGPYTRSDGRKHVIHYNLLTRQKRTQSYPRYLLEKKLGKKIPRHLEVDHKDNNPFNNKLSNLQLLTKRANILKSVSPRKYLTFECPVCYEIATKPLNKVKANRKQNKAGPFCSKSCAHFYQYNLRAGVC